MWDDELYILGNSGSFWSLRYQDQFSTVAAVDYWRQKQNNTKARAIEHRNATINLEVSGWKNKVLITMKLTEQRHPYL